jgi:hypothetical protein
VVGDMDVSGGATGGMDVVGDTGYLRECYADVGAEEQQVHIRATRRDQFNSGRWWCLA